MRVCLLVGLQQPQSLPMVAAMLLRKVPEAANAADDSAAYACASAWKPLEASPVSQQQAEESRHAKRSLKLLPLRLRLLQQLKVEAIAEAVITVYIRVYMYVCMYIRTHGNGVQFNNLLKLNM